jgi:hypothetical protein
MASPSGFLGDRPGARPWPKLPEGGRASFEPIAYHLGEGDNPLEVRVARASGRPNVSDVRTLWERIWDKRPSPVILVVLFPTGSGERAIACGPAGDKPPVTPPLDPGQLERISDAALDEPNRHAAIKLLNSALPDAESDLPGVRNAGMFATHELRAGVPLRPDWATAASASKPLLTKKGRELVEGLGFTVEQHSASASLLRSEGTASAIAVFLEEHETPEGPSTRFNGLSPVSHALAAADKDRIPWVVVTRGPEIRVYSANPDVGVGRKGRAETFIGLNLSLLPDDLAAYLQLIFGSDALKPGGSFEEILDRSKDFSAELGKRLRERVYVDVVPDLAEAIAARYEFDEEATDADFEFVYQMALVLLFRLLFIAYAEDKDVLPYRRNGMYAHRALKTLARELSERWNAGQTDFDEEQTDLWQQVRQLSNAVGVGNSDWGVPPYDGRLFSGDRTENESGYELDSIEPLTNAELGPPLRALLVDEGDDGVYGPVDFRSLSVREFGTIYEGLLESSLSLASADLTVDAGGTYVPARRSDEIYVEQGAIYLHNRSGARKASGSYFTKPFAVEHLLDHALEPALDSHLERIEALLAAGKEADAADTFFDFRCADIAMGSGHFLVGAVDRIEARLSSFLAAHPMPLIIKELDELRAAAIEHLGPLGVGIDVEHASLLRRLVGRRCVYGVDLNPIAVELARLAIWIHTFVPGLPLSFLDHNLTVGNSLTGVASIEEAEHILEPNWNPNQGQPTLYHDTIVEWLGRAKEHLQRLGRVSESSIAEVKEARAENAKAMKAVEPARDLLDLLVAVRLGQAAPLVELTDSALSKHKDLARARELATEELSSLHFPIAFPEVFLRDRAGFDCILGNPPWEEATVEELGFWAIRFPGLKSLKQKEQRDAISRLRKQHPSLVEEYEAAIAEAALLRQILLAGPYPGMGAGDPDLYKAFAWRFWQLTSPDGGTIGVVLPRSALSANGSADWRTGVLAAGDFMDVTQLLNSKGWVFEDVHPQYSVGLVSIRRTGSPDDRIQLRGPYDSMAAFANGIATAPVELEVAHLRSWSPGAAFPLIPGKRAGEAFAKIRSHPRLDAPGGEWPIPRPVREFDATNDKRLFHTDLSKRPRGYWPVYKGASFDIWTPDTGQYYAWADPKVVTDVLQKKRVGGISRKGSVFEGMDRAWAKTPARLPCRHPRVAFRDITNRTNSRTVIACLVPPNLVLTNKGPYLLWPHGDELDQAYLLGVLCSIPLDWYSRRVVEINLNFFIFNSLPIPRPARDDRRRMRVIEIAGRLAAADQRFAGWADAIGVPVSSVGSDEERSTLICELDAVVASLYGLSTDDVRVVYETFHPTWDHAPRLEAVLDHLKIWENAT